MGLDSILSTLWDYCEDCIPSNDTHKTCKPMIATITKCVPKPQEYTDS